MHHRQLAARDPIRYVGKRFVVNETFGVPGFQTVYMKGLSYNVDNRELASYAIQWEADGKISFIEGIAARVIGF